MNYENFDGFITRDGEMVSIKDVDRMISIVSQHTENVDQMVQALWSFAGECFEAGHFSAASDYCQKVLILVDEPVAKAKVLLAMEKVRQLSGRHRDVAGYQLH